MSDTMVQPGLSLGGGGDDGSIAPSDGNRKMLLIGGVVAVIGAGVFLYARSKKASSTAATTTGTPTVIYPSTGSAANTQGYYDSLLAGIQNSGGTTSTALANLQQALEQAITAQGGTTPPPGSTTPPPSGGGNGGGSTGGGSGGGATQVGNVNGQTGPEFNPAVNPFGLGANLPGQPAGSPGDSLSYKGTTYQPYLGSLSTPGTYGTPLDGAPVGSISGYQDTATGSLADTVVSPGTIQEVNTATGAAVGNAYMSPSAQGYYTGAPTAYKGGGVGPGQVLVNGEILTEAPNATGGYG